MKNQLRNRKNLLINKKNASDCCCSCKIYDSPASLNDWKIISGNWSLYRGGTGLSCSTNQGFIYFKSNSEQQYIDCYFFPNDLYNVLTYNLINFSIRLIVGYNIEENFFYFGEFRTRPDLPGVPHISYPMIELIIGQSSNGLETILCNQTYNIYDWGYYTFDKEVNNHIYFGYNNDSSTLVLGRHNLLYTFPTFLNISYPIPSPSGHVGISNGSFDIDKEWQLTDIEIYKHNENKDDCINVPPLCCDDCDPEYVVISIGNYYEPMMKSYDMWCLGEQAQSCFSSSNTVDVCTGRPICRICTDDQYGMECGPLFHRCNNGILEYKNGKCVYTYPPIHCPASAYIECRDVDLPWISTGTPCIIGPGGIYTTWNHHIFSLACTYDCRCDESLNIETYLNYIGKLLAWLNTKPTIILSKYSFCTWKGYVNLYEDMKIVITATHTNGVWSINFMDSVHPTRELLYFVATDKSECKESSILYYVQSRLETSYLKNCVANLLETYIMVQGL